MNIGIIGTGRIAHTMANAAVNAEGVKLAAVASRDIEKAKKFAGEYGSGISSYGSYEDMYKDPAIDLVYIATPHGRHFEDVSNALENGKNVLCEKSFTINAGETEALIKLAREKNLFLCEAMWPRFNPVTKKYRQWMEEGRIGRTISTTSTFGFVVTKPDFNTRLFRMDCGGGSLLDVGVYPVAFTSLAFGGETPTKISAFASKFENGSDKLMCAMIAYGDSICQVSSSLKADMKPRGIIFGEKGMIKIEDLYTSPYKATLHLYSGEEDEVFAPENMKDGYVYQLEGVRAAIESGKKECSEMPLDESLTIMRTMDTIREQIDLKYPNDLK